MTSLCYSITLENSRFSCIRCAGFCWMGDRVGSGLATGPLVVSSRFDYLGFFRKTTTVVVFLSTI